MKIKMTQHQQVKNKLSFKQVQNLKLLEMPFERLKELSDQLIESNPLVEIDYERANSIKKSDFEEILQFASKKKTLKEVLLEQLSYSEIKNRSAAEYIIQSLDSNGYLQDSEEELMNILRLDCSEIAEIIKTIQTFTPAGVACRNLKECLLVQLCFVDHPYDPLAIQIVYNHLDLLAKNKLEEIAKNCNVSLKEVIRAKKHIQSLNPKPGSLYEMKVEYKIPEVFIEVEENEIKVYLTAQRPFFKVKQVESMLDEETKKYVQEKTQEAYKVIKGIDKRYDTMMKVVKELVLVQRDYFVKNDVLRPLTYQQVGSRIGLNPSTICRCVQDKYLFYNGECILLKDFFSIHVYDGKSQHEMMREIESLIHHEDKSMPYSDQMIVNLLKKKGIEISRRTVSKYREQLKIPIAKMRKDG